MSSRRFSVDHVPDEQFLSDLGEARDPQSFARLVVKYERQRLRQERLKLVRTVLLAVVVFGAAGVGLGALITWGLEP